MLEILNTPDIGAAASLMIFTGEINFGIEFVGFFCISDNKVFTDTDSQLYHRSIVLVEPNIFDEFANIFF